MQDTARSPRKSVAFSEGTTVVDGNGDVTKVNGHTRKTSAENHTLGTLVCTAIRLQKAKAIQDRLIHQRLRIRR